MIAGLAAQVRVALNDLSGALAIYREALQDFPQAQVLGLWLRGVVAEFKAVRPVPAIT